MHGARLQVTLLMVHFSGASRRGKRLTSDSYPDHRTPNYRDDRSEPYAYSQTRDFIQIREKLLGVEPVLICPALSPLHLHTLLNHFSCQRVNFHTNTAGNIFKLVKLSQTVNKPLLRLGTAARHPGTFEADVFCQRLHRFSSGVLISIAPTSAGKRCARKVRFKEQHLTVPSQIGDGRNLQKQ